LQINYTSDLKKNSTTKGQEQWQDYLN